MDPGLRVTGSGYGPKEKHGSGSDPKTEAGSKMKTVLNFFQQNNLWKNGKFLTCNEINGILRRPFYSILDYLQVKALQEVWKSHLRQRTSSPSPTDSLGHFGYCSSLSLYRKKVPGSSSVLVLVILPLGPWS